MSMPQIPPRPARLQQQQHPDGPDLNVPQIPPRPRRRTSERSQSPNRENFPRSPFNEPPIAMSQGSRSGGMYSSSQNASRSNLPERPPSVSLPSVGQEGNEYADIDFRPEGKEEEDTNDSPKETRNVAGDLPLHAPKPSFSTSTAKDRVSTVTRTDSSQAAAAGIGKVSTPSTGPDDADPQDRNLKPKVSFMTASSASTERPSSAALVEDEHGIPEIGQRVPMYPDAGDVQAPSPSPFQQQFPVGIGFHNSGIAKPAKHHRRTPSGRDSLPPGSYGLHGHGVQSVDHFEKEWYAKHPEALEKDEHGEYGPGIGGGRGEFALSSDDLNKLVRQTSRTAPDPNGLPNEQIGYKASEDYVNRLSTPPLSATFRMAHSNSSQPHVESPLRKASFPVDPDAGQIIQKTRGYATSNRSNENALESETEDEGVHVSPPAVRKSKYTGNGYDPPTQDLGPHGGNTEALGGYIEERGYGVPILASDEVAKTPGAEFMQPAVSPVQERRGSTYYSGVDGNGEYQSGFNSGSRPGSAADSRPTSRPASIHSSGLANLSRFSTYDEDRENMHTPLEDVDEYEPLFPEDEDGDRPRKPLTPAQRLKMRENLKRFPSQDIWEDTPSSLQLQTTVETPEAAKEKKDPMAKPAGAVFETAEQEAARKGEPSEEEKAKLIPREERLAKSQFQPHIVDEMRRPGSRQRFPSRDIWEDTPDSAQLEATVGESRGDPDLGLVAGAVVQTSGSPKDGIIAGEQARDNATVGAPAIKPEIPPRPSKSKQALTSTDGESDTMPPPSVPARPPRRLHQVPPADAQVPITPSRLAQETTANSPTDGRKGPTLPERPKPQIPARTSKPVTRESSETTPLSKMNSASSVGSDEPTERDAGVSLGAPKAKPAVPARPVCSKIASLKAGFMGDLESRLKLGPQAPPKPRETEPEAEEEQKPLDDARKGRARGPARRKPVAAAAVPDTFTTDVKPTWSIQQPWTVWQTDATGAVSLGYGGPVKTLAEPTAGSSETRKDDRGDVTSPSMPGSFDSADEPREMEQAKLAVEESLHAKDPLTKEKLMTPAATEAPISSTGANNIVSSPEASAARPPSPATVVSPDTATAAPLSSEKTMNPLSPVAPEQHVNATAGTATAGEGDSAVKDLS